MFVGDGETDGRRRSGFVICLVVLLCCSPVAGPVSVGLAATGAASPDGIDSPVTVERTESAGSSPTVGGSTSEADEPAPDEGPSSDTGGTGGVTIDSAIETAGTEGDTVEVVVRLAEVDVDPAAPGPPDRVTERLRDHAVASQRAVVDYAERTDGVTVRNRFWLTNAVVLEVDTSRVDLAAFERFDAVSMLHANFDVELESAGAVGGTAAGETDGAATEGVATMETESVSTSSGDATYGLEQIRAPTVWEEYGTRGEGAKVAVLDTGIDVDHPDLDLYTEDSSDPTYPGGWAEFDRWGNRVVGSEPRDFGDHGTHVSGTVAGGAASGTHIGVAPDADLLHGAVLTSCDDGCAGTYAQIIEGLQWAVDEDADVASLSLGTDGYEERFIDPVRNANAAGTVVVSSAGNGGAGTSGSPGNVYETVAVGASTESEEIASFSSGEEITTAEAWDDPPSDWPDTYNVPNVVAPGSWIPSSLPDDEYGYKSGTSMAAPHVTGAMALLLSINDGLDPDELLATLEETARKPGGDDGQDTRYGHGIVDAKAAADVVALGTIEGTVTDAAGNPVANATVSVDDEQSTRTDGDGRYALQVEPGTRNVTIDSASHHPETATVDLERRETVIRDVTLEFAALAAAQNDLAEASGTTAASFDVVELEEVTVSLGAESTIAAENVSFAVDGHEEPVAPGETVTFDEPVTDDRFTVTARLADEPDLEGTLELEHVFAREARAGDGSVGSTTESRTIQTGPTTVVPQLYDVGVIGDESASASAAVLDALAEGLPRQYRLSQVDPDEAVSAAESGTYEAFVVLELPGDHDLLENPTAAFVDETTASHTGVLYLGAVLDGADPLARLEADTDEIERVTASDHDGGDAAEIVVEAAHPILEGVGTERESVAVLENGSRRAWVDAPNARTLASATDDGVLADGPGLAYDRADEQVFLGLTPRAGTLTADGRRTLGNAVRYLGAGAAYVVDGGETYGVSGGDAESITFGVPEPGTATVDLADGTTADPAALTLEVDGRTIEPEDEVEIDDETVAQGLTVAVSADERVDGEDVRIALTVEGETATTGPIRFEPDPPARYAGTVAVNDEPVRDGLTVSAVSEGAVVGAATTRDGRFGVPEADGGAGVLEVNRADLPADEEGAGNGTVTFVLEHARTNTSVAWEAGDERQTDLAVAYDDPFASATVDAVDWTTAGSEVDVTVGIDEAAAAYLTDREWLGDPATVGDDGTDATPPWNATYAVSEADEGHAAVGARLTDLAGEHYTVSERVLVIDGEPTRLNGTISTASDDSSLLTGSDDGVIGSVFVTPDHGRWTDERPVEDGSFEATTETNASTHGAFVAASGEYPVYQSLFDRVIEDGETVAVELEDGHELSIAVRDEDGEPVENASVAVSPTDAAATDDAVVTLEGRTDATGNWTGPNGDGTGATMTGPVTITVAPPASDADAYVDEVQTRTVTVDDDTAVAFELAARSEGSGGIGFGPLPDRPSDSGSMTLTATPRADGSARLAVSDASPGETARTALTGVGADGVSITEVTVTAARDRSREAFTIRPGRRGFAVTHRTGAFTYVGVDHDGADRTLERLTVAFSIDDEALPDGATAEDVVVAQHRNGEWESVETEFDGTGYEATVDGPAPIAIGVEGVAPEVTVVDSSVRPSEIAPGESVAVAATVENTGDVAVGESVTIATDGEALETRRLDLAPGERTTVTIDATLEESATITLEGSAEVAVEDSAIGSVTASGTDESVLVDVVPGFGVAAALVAVGFVLVARARW